MNRTYFKLLARGVRSTLARFISILAIVTVGVGFLSGLLATTPDMLATADKYYDDNRMFDIDVRGDLGMTESDVQTLAAQDYVETAMGARVTDLEMAAEDGTGYVTRIYGVPLDEYGTAGFVNGFELLEGRMPENTGECVLAAPNEYTAAHTVGEKYTISADNKDYENLGDTYAFDSLTVVGIVRSPYYMSMESEPSTVGTGRVGLIMFVQPECYTLDVFTDVFLTLNGARALGSFDDDYFALVDSAAEKLGQLGISRCEIRYDEVTGDAGDALADAKTELADAEREADEKLTDARRKLDDAKADLEDAKVKLADAKTEIADKKKELADAEQEIADGRAAITDAEKEVADNTAKLADAQKAVDEGYAQLADSKTELDSGYSQLAAAKSALESGRDELNTKLAAAKAQADAAKPYIPAEQYEAALAQIEQQRQQGEAKLAEAEAEIEAAEQKLASAQAEYDAGAAKLAESQAEIALGKVKLTQAKDEISDNKKKLDDAQAELDDGRIKLADAETQLADSETELADGEKKIADAESEYSDKKAEADEKLADARQKIADAEREVGDIERPEWYVTDRRDTVSFHSYKSNTSKIEAIAKVFPMFFFLVAALVALTTMTRMVEEERTQTGTLKAIGYSDRRILFYYLGYSMTASLAGSALGILIGTKSLPAVISNAYGMMYTLPDTLLLYYPKQAVLISAIAVACTTLATLWACLDLLAEKPARLMLPKTPKAGRRVFLERIGFIWKRMSFIWKVTARNILRYKKRFYMTVFGIAGCCALLVTGFGLRDSIHDIVDLQFGEIYQYNLMLYLREDGAAQTDPTVSDFLNNDSRVTGWAEMHYESVTVGCSDGTEKATLYMAADDAQLKQQILLRERIGGADIPFDENSVVLTEKMCETLGISKGDTVTLTNDGGDSAQVTVTGVTENYITGYVFIGTAAYEKAFGAGADHTLVLADLSDESEAAREDISQKVLQSDEILLLQYSQTIRESFENTVASIDYIVIVLIISAAVLAVIVVYNLTNINICERRKELATIKVLGFYDGEVAAYIYRETSVLCLIGILVGLAFGVWLHSFVVRTAEVDAVMFGRSLHFTSFLFAAAVTAVFTALVDIVMKKKLDGIDMVESMKANE